MSKPKVLIFAPREEPPETITALEGLGCEVVVGNRDWQLPRTHYEDDVVEAARDAVALMGTSMQTIGQAWLVLVLTHSAWQLGLVGEDLFSAAPGVA